MLGLLLIAAVWLIGSCGGGGGPEPDPGPTPEEIRAEKARQKARERAREDRAIEKVLGYTTFVSKGGGKRRQVALTFDDGPSPYTGQVLDILRRNKVPATFFVLGSGVAEEEQALRRVEREGHVVANHSFGHPAMGNMDLAGQREELASQEEAVSSTGIEQHRLFRPPYRSFNQSTFDLLAERNDLMVLWSVDTDDYASYDPQAIVDRVLNEVEPGSIVLMHDGGGERSTTVKALPGIIKGLRRKKLKPVTVPRMLINDPPPRTTDRYPEGL